MEIERVFDRYCMSCGKKLKTVNVNIKNREKMNYFNKIEHPYCDFCKAMMSGNVKGYDAYGRKIK